MKEIIVNNNTYLFILLNVPEDAKDYWVNNIGCIRYSHNKDRESSVIEPIEIGKYLEKNEWVVISTTKDITEKQAKSIVRFERTKAQYKGEPYSDGYNYFFNDYKLEVLNYGNAKESLQSLIQANGLDITKNYLILKRI